MTRVLRYPRLSALSVVAVMACALGRDACVSASLQGWAQVLLVATLALLPLCIALLSCRFFVDEGGVGVGFLFRVRRTPWKDLAALGLLCCNSRRRYFYGMYHSSTDFINLIHRAPQCGSWGFVVPVSNRLIRAITQFCPFDVNLSAIPRTKHNLRLRIQWHQAAVQTAILLPSAALTFVTGALMLIRASGQSSGVLSGTLLSLSLFTAGLMLLSRLTNTVSTCPRFSEEGVGAGRGVYLPWADVRFGYVHRIAQMSGLFLLSQPLETAQRRGAPPILCLSMPDTRTILLAYLTYCPHANQGIDL